MTRDQMDRELGYLADQIDGLEMDFRCVRRLSDDEAAARWEAHAAALRKQSAIRKAIVLACLGIMGGICAGVGAVLFSIWMGLA